MLQRCNVLNPAALLPKEALPKHATAPLHNLKPGGMVVVRDLRRKAFRKTGPHLVSLTTQSAVKEEGGHQDHGITIPIYLTEYVNRPDTNNSLNCSIRQLLNLLRQLVH